MTDRPYVSTSQLMDKIEELEQRLAPPPKPDFNDTLRAVAKEARDKNSKTVDMSELIRKGNNQ